MTIGTQNETAMAALPAGQLERDDVVGLHTSGRIDDATLRLPPAPLNLTATGRGRLAYALPRRPLKVA